MDSLHEGHELALLETWEVLKEHRVKRLFKNKDGETIAALNLMDNGEVTDDTCIDSHVYCYTCNHRVAHDDVI